MKSKSWCSPRQLVVLMVAGWINRHQQAVIAYQKEEIKGLRERLGSLLNYYYLMPREIGTIQ